jgi:hypothetical protein
VCFFTFYVQIKLPPASSTSSTNLKSLFLKVGSVLNMMQRTMDQTSSQQWKRSTAEHQSFYDDDHPGPEVLHLQLRSVADIKSREWLLLLLAPVVRHDFY